MHDISDMPEEKMIKMPTANEEKLKKRSPLAPSQTSAIFASPWH